MFCGGVRMSQTLGRTVPPAVKARLAQVLPRVWDNIPQKHFEALWKSMTACVEAVIEAKGWYTRYWANLFVAVTRWECRVGTLGLACILTLPQHIVKIFYHLHRLSYYVVMLRYFFCILFSSLYCAVIGFVAGIVHGVLLDIFCFWAYNSPYFILIFLLP